ncbi:MAG: CCA tRNA nucleotidyltransferase [Candidatus Korarchaeota archaeon]|nr:CCA tRNA nucleotidyltransferase [Candidatus Korarchaeota archaeon]
MPRDMPPSSELDKVLKRARELVTPSDAEREELKEALKLAVERVKDVIEEMGLDAEVVPVGSAVRDTWLPGNYELDIFVLFPKEAGDKRVLGEIIEKIAWKAFGKFEQNYAEHPYVIVKFGKFEIDLVPAYRIRKGEKVISAVDRTPLHNAYVLSKLKEPQEVRLLKAFLKSIGAYGAEEKVGGFSGYLCEVLVIYYGSFLGVLRDAADWVPSVYIDPESHLTEEYALSMFDDPLIVIDPVDPRRNVAAALIPTQFHRFKAAARAFLTNPSIEFFERGLRPRKRNVRPSIVENELKRRGTHLIIVELDGLDDLSRELLWSQAKKLARVLKEELTKQEFQPVWVAGWTDEGSTIVVAAELPSLVLPPLEKKVGPPVGVSEETNFLSKYMEEEGKLGGPFIEGNRWYVYRKRRYEEASLLVSDILRSNRMPTVLRGRASVRVLSEGEVASLSQWTLNEIWEELVKEEFFTKYLVRVRGSEQ